MKSLLIYFSQTGNTRRVAKCIQDGIIEQSGQCDITPLNDVKAKLLLDYDLIGIGCPVFYYKEPFNVSSFIESLPDLNGQHWFIFCTHANVIGYIFPSMEEKLGEKGATVIGYHNTYSSLTVPYYPNPSYTTGHPDDYDFNQAKAFGREIVLRSEQLKKSPDSVLIPSPNPVSSKEWIQEGDKLTQDYLGQIMPKLSIDMELCNKCHACVKNCPVKGIDIEEELPRIQAPCIYCWRCVNICPTLAIRANWDKLVSIAPMYYARYRKVLDEAAARGEFRWLIDPETINFDNPFYKQRERKLTNKKLMDRNVPDKGTGFKT